MNRRRVLETVAALGTGGAVAGCSALQGEEGSAAEQGVPEGDGNSSSRGTTETTDGMDEDEPALPSPVTTNFPSPSFDVIHYIQFPVLQEVLQEQHDTDLNEEVFSGHVPLIGSLVESQAEAQLASVGTQAVIDAQNQGLPVKITRGYATEFFHALIADADMGGLADLEGSTVAVHAPTSTSRSMVSVVAEAEFGSADAVDLQYIIGTSNRLAALEAGEVDAVVGLMPSGVQAELDGYGQVVARPWEYEPLTNVGVLGWLSLEPTIDQHEAQLRQLHAAIDEAHERIYERDAETVVDDALATDIYPEYDREAWLRAFEVARDQELWPRQRRLTDEQLDGLQSMLVDTGLLEAEQRRDPEEIRSDRFLD